VAQRATSAPEERASVIHGGLSFAEAPRWQRGRLWYSDFYRHGVYSLAPDGSDERFELEVLSQPSGLGWHANGDLLVVSMTDQRVLRYDGTNVTVFAELADHSVFWCNDMLVSPAGYCYVGNFGFDLDEYLGRLGRDFDPAMTPTTTLVVLDPDGRIVQTIDAMAFPNGVEVTSDVSTLIVAETMASRLSAFDVASDGTLTNRRVWTAVEGSRPDGLCIDDEGAVWFADAMTTHCVRVREGGRIDAVVTTSQPAFACALGGDDRRTLFVTCAPSGNRFEVADTRNGTIEAAWTGGFSPVS